MKELEDMLFFDTRGENAILGPWRKTEKWSIPQSLMDPRN